ncbi:MAG: hypothetical protein ACD_42C00139G0001 [uncultured bacterium]|nr:MAG: hypothetical protein ACD_42C00139G0001 [uncultured bacterium]OGT34211.1 MAG: hypothetical protein A3C44_03170 [Gammaproteobacteria bacterium RIFCSPHIGHO2_02_FULL_39_13]OGT50343.1 MAG: hypothetical protein A3E53_01160 [Gammaproteobacteria bacterium RIFCSPHIGHO2_12_FULL_39_24]
MGIGNSTEKKGDKDSLNNSLLGGGSKKYGGVFDRTPKNNSVTSTGSTDSANSVCSSAGRYTPLKK